MLKQSKEGLEKRLVDTYRIQCLGVGTNGRPALPENKRVPVIVKIFNDGTSIPLCQYLWAGSTSDPYVEGECRASDNESEWKNECPYRTFG